MTDHDRFEVVDALTAAAKSLGWRPSAVDSSEHRITFIVIAPLARSRPERNRWSDEPEEGEEPSQEERAREFAPDWDVDDLGQPVNQRGPITALPEAGPEQPVPPRPTGGG